MVTRCEAVTNRGGFWQPFSGETHQEEPAVSTPATEIVQRHGIFSAGMKSERKREGTGKRREPAEPVPSPTTAEFQVTVVALPSSFRLVIDVGDGWCDSGGVSGHSEQRYNSVSDKLRIILDSGSGHRFSAVGGNSSD
ncbi:hypothetical protein Hdeb2414_s0002g00064221 [Helianthus debilis subsp. tardiflorus]